jgi:hypothetical protein
MDAHQSLAPLGRSCSASLLALASNTFHAHLDRAARICTVASVKGTSIHRCAANIFSSIFCTCHWCLRHRDPATNGICVRGLIHSAVWDAVYDTVDLRSLWDGSIDERSACDLVQDFVEAATADFIVLSRRAQF